MSITQWNLHPCTLYTRRLWIFWNLKDWNFLKFENLIPKIKVLNASTLDFMHEDVNFDEEAMKKETEKIERYSDRFITIKRKVDDF